MGTPVYEARKVGDTYKMVRVDPQHKIKLSTMTVGGGLLAILGIARRGILGTALIVVGGGLVYCGLAECDPLKGVSSIFRSRRANRDTVGASYLRQRRPHSTQLPEDELDEASMESFPASDPPARTAVARL